jgi:hypothetical protein
MYTMLIDISEKMPHLGWNIPKSITKPNGCWTYPKCRHFPAVLEIAATWLK